jgi:CheY-like chemotaxis protein
MAQAILLVDDSATIRRVTREYIENNTEYEVCGEAFDGQDALDKVRELAPDLIIMDLAMPRMNGMQAAKILRATTDVPIILFTMYASEIRTADALAAGVNAVVSKIEDLAVLGEELRHLLKPVSGTGSRFAASA